MEKQPQTWLNEVVEALIDLGGEGSLKAIYEQITVRKRKHLPNPNWSSSVRRTLEHYSSDTTTFRTRKGSVEEDIFYAPKGLGAGYWAIRKPYLEKLKMKSVSIPNYWVEKTLVKGYPERESGEYALGRVLRSPQKGKGGADIYRFMREIQPGDLILHLTDNTAITGISYAESTYEEIESLTSNNEIESYYIVRLRGFRRLEPPLTRNTFFASPYREQLIALLNTDIKNLFYNREPNLNQGAYLTPAPFELIDILNEAYQKKTGRSLFDLIDDVQSSPGKDDAKELKEPDPISTLPEKEFLDHIRHYIEARGYYFDDETLYNYHICLKTRPFVILAGLSGTGKSKLSQLYAEAIGHTTKNGRYLRLPVRPSWNDDRYLIGYLNSITGEYVVEPALEFLIRANNDKDNLYFFCLDEMNLAHVEYYFSQFLSAMEEDNPDYREITLISTSTKAHLIAQEIIIDVPPSVLIPTNLLFTETINVDETTQPLSDKVMDRANTIEFFAVDLDKIPEPQPLSSPIRITSSTWHNYQSRQSDTKYRSQIISIAKILNEGDMGLGYRVVRDIELYLSNSKDLLTPEVAFDLQVKQRILPHVRGTKAIEKSLDKLLDFVKDNSLVRSFERLQEMKTRLVRDGYVNFWR
jgi:energy-coupling factor transporter ATP-binding protein EcfA2